jgi:hypothetical protein
MSEVANEDILRVVDSLKDETVQRLVDLVNIGSLLDTPEEMKVQVCCLEKPEIIIFADLHGGVFEHLGADC